LLELAIKQSLDTGVIDGNHLGISGNSAGSTNTRWALLNSHLFSAAAVGSCCEDMTSIITTYGEAGANEMRRYGFPGLTDDGSAFWAPYSFRLNARRMKTPLLMQLPDHEYLAALECYYALREQNSPTEMYVFPDEFHEKWHPVHRRAVYERGLDWFKFWLMGQEDNNPAKQDQYKRWRSLRANLPGPGASSGR
jgi:dipeptidyl aminopeptidase/acylaminoacyl peptidase